MGGAVYHNRDKLKYKPLYRRLSMIPSISLLSLASIIWISLPCFEGCNQVEPPLIGEPVQRVALHPEGALALRRAPGLAWCTAA